MTMAGVSHAHRCVWCGLQRCICGINRHQPQPTEIRHEDEIQIVSQRAVDFLLASADFKAKTPALV